MPTSVCTPQPPAAQRTSTARGLGRPAVCLAAATVVLLGCPLGTPSYAAERSHLSPATDLRPGSGVWPLDPRPRVVHGFDPPATRYGSGHRGVDLAGHVGQVVHAAQAGRVSFAGRLAGRGVVVVDHGGTRTTYEPVLATVHVGDQVATGGRVGLLQLVGSHCFPAACLHWGLIQGRATYLDPLTLVGAVPVVLLPRSGSVSASPPGPGRTGPLLSDRTGRSSASLAVVTDVPVPALRSLLLAPQRSVATGRVVLWPPE